MKHLNLLGAGVLLSLLATTAPAHAQDQSGYYHHSQQDQQDQQDQAWDNQGRDARTRHEEDRQDKAQRKDDRQDQRQAEQVSRAQRDQAIREQKQREATYSRNLAEQQQAARRAAAQLQQQNRREEYRQHQDYLNRLAEQQRDLRHSYDYRRDPFFSTPASYRYYRDGHSYQTNQYGAQVLRQAINNGYSEGYRAGAASRADRWRGSYRDVFAYQDANYGFSGRYVSQSEYNYYFRQGFQRGYGDGYGNNRRYGDDNGSVLADVLGQILNLQSFR